VSTTAIVCCRCGIEFWVPTHFQAKRREDGVTFYCPSGHLLSFGQSEVDKLHAELVTERRRRLSAETRRDTEARSAAAMRGHMTRLKKHAAAGRCPCCRQTFQALARHMKNQHPDYVEPNETN